MCSLQLFTISKEYEITSLTGQMDDKKSLILQ